MWHLIFKQKEAAVEDDTPMREEYRDEEPVEAHARFIRFVGYVVVAHTLGMLGCYAAWQEYKDIEGAEGVLLSSAMIFAIGLATALAAYAMFRHAVAMSREAIEMRKAAGDDEYGLSLARDRQADAVLRAKNGFKPLNFSGVCFVASTLLAISGMLSL